MKNRVCKLSFHLFAKEILTAFANGVNNGIFSNPSVFTSPPLATPELVHIIDDYSVALSNYETYGKTKKTIYLSARSKLMDALNLLAAYVNGIANGDASIISLAGFEPTAGSSQAAPELDKIITLTVTPNNIPGRLIIETPAIVGKGVMGYGLILVNGAPLGSNSFVNGKLIYSGGTDQVIIVDVTKSKKKVIDGLDSNVLYNAYMYAFNATGVSPLSFPQVVKCM